MGKFFRFHLLADLTEASLSRLIIKYCLVKILFSKVRPSNVGKIQFSIRKLVK